MPYQDPSDFRLLPELARLAPPEAETFVAFDKAVGRDDGAIAIPPSPLCRSGGGVRSRPCSDAETGYG